MPTAIWCGGGGIEAWIASAPAPAPRHPADREKFRQALVEPVVEQGHRNLGSDDDAEQHPTNRERRQQRSSRADQVARRPQTAAKRPGVTARP